MRKSMSLFIVVMLILSIVTVGSPLTVSVAASGVQINSNGVNLIKNPEFDNGMTSWVSGFSSPATGAFSVAEGQNMSGTNALMLTITNGGTATTSITVKQHGLALVSGKTYSLSFMAKADAIKRIGVGVSETAGDYTRFVSQYFDLTPTLQTFTSGPFTINHPDALSTLSFNLGGNTISAYIDQVVLVEITPTPTPVPATYYIDSTAGNDSNSGTSPSTAWQSLEKVNATTFQPGDRILFKAGCSWTGTLYPKGSGTHGNHITIDMYGTGNKPIINGNGKAYSAEDPIDSAVYLCNQDFWTIRNLEITNDSAIPDKRAGIHVEGTRGNHGDITIQSCYLHNIANDGNSGYHPMAAIVVWSRSYASAFKNILIDNNMISNTSGAGINLNAAKGLGSAVNNRITNNTLTDIGADAIIVNDCTGPLVEHNVVNGWHTRSTTYCAGIWPFACDDAVIQFNEVYGGRTTLDGQGFDCDYQCNRTIMQYNYSHDNEGGFMLVCCEPDFNGKPSYNDGSIIRYNISQNDQNTIFNLTTKITNTRIYNNTIYLGYSSSAEVVKTGSKDGINFPTNTTFENNIFYNLGSVGYKNLTASINTVFDYNVFYGSHTSNEPNDAHKLTSDPMFLYPGYGANGPSTLEGYKLQVGSSCIASGKLIDNNGGRDYWGNPVSSTAAPNRGAYNGVGLTVSETPPPITPPAPTPTPTAGENDEFNSTTLGTQWSFVRPYANNWSLSANPGYMRIIGTATDLGGVGGSAQNILLQTAKPGDWRIVTKVDGKPTAAWQQCGLIVYQDDDNYFKLVRHYGTGYGNVFQFVREVDGTTMNDKVPDNIASTISYLMIEKIGDTYKGYFSADGITYTQVWSTQTASFNNIKVGLINLAGKGLISDFDYFRYLDLSTPLPTTAPTPSPTPAPVNLALNKSVTVDSTYTASYPGSKAVDGIKSTDAAGQASRWLSGNSTAVDHWIDVDLGGSYTINEVKFWTGSYGYSYPISNYKIQVGDGTTWTDVVTRSGNTSAVVDEIFETVTARHVRLYCIKPNNDGIVRLYEIEVYYTPGDNVPPVTTAVLSGT